MPFLRLVLSVIVFLSAMPAWAQEGVSLRSIETRGLYNTPAQGQISGNVWEGLNRNEALLLIDSIPPRFTSPTFYRLAQNLLLSDAPPVPSAPIDKKAKPDANAEANAAQMDPNRPDILIARLDKLMEIGALRAAEKLYDTVVGDIPNNFDLAYRSLQILMLRGQLTAACVDVQAMQGMFGADPRWQELNRLCRIQFAQGAERAKLLNETKFTAFPSLGKFLRGSGNMGRLSSLSVEDLAFAVATNLVGENTMRLMAPKAGQITPLLLSVLYRQDESPATPEKICLAIEGVRRGILDTRELITLYEAPHYDSDWLVGAVNAPAPVHACMIPTVLYQRIASNKDNPAKRDAVIRYTLDVLKGMPDAALWPMAVYFKDFDVRAAQNKPYLWRVSRVLAYEKGELPGEWAQDWGARLKDGSVGRGVSPFWLVNAIVSPSLASEENLEIWRAQWPSEVARIESRDPILPYILGLIPPGQLQTGDNPKTKTGNYENKISLTFSRTYAMPSYGLTQRLANVIEKGHTGQSVALLLIGYGAIPPDQIIPDQMALILEGLNKAGLRKDAQRVALEVLR